MLPDHPLISPISHSAAQHPWNPGLSKNVAPAAPRVARVGGSGFRARIVDGSIGTLAAGRTLPPGRNAAFRTVYVHGRSASNPAPSLSSATEGGSSAIATRRARRSVLLDAAALPPPTLPLTTLPLSDGGATDDGGRAAAETPAVAAVPNDCDGWDW